MSRNSRFRYKLVTPPDAEPVSEAEMVLFIKDIDDADLPLMNQQITAARQQVESYLNRFLINQTWIASADNAPANIFELSGGRIEQVDNIKVFDNDGNDEEVDSSNYYVDQEGARVGAKSGTFWPNPQQALNGFQVQFVGGYGATAADVPEPIKNAIKQLVVHWYEYREPVMIGSITKVLEFSMIEILNTYRINNI